MRRAIAMLAAGVCVLPAGNARAQSAEDFYRGSQMRFIIGSTSASDYDVWARLIGRYMTRHIPGQPNLIVENMPGAGQVLATNYLYNLAPKTGAVIGMVSRSMPSAAVMKVANIRFEPDKFNWLGSPEVNHLVMYVNNNAGIASMSDLFERELIVGGTSAAQGLTVGPLLLKNMLGMKIRVITGYNGPAEMSLAAARGELQAFANTIGGPAGARRPWVENGQMRVLFNFEPEPVRGLGVPTVFEHVKSEEHRKVLTFFAGNVLLGRPMLAPPGVPGDRVAVLRQALAAALKDPDLLKDAATAKLEITHLTGERLTELVANIASTPPQIIELAERYSQSDEKK